MPASMSALEHAATSLLATVVISIIPIFVLFFIPRWFADAASPPSQAAKKSRRGKQQPDLDNADGSEQPSAPIAHCHSLHSSTLNLMLSFAAGALLGDAFLHLLPHGGEAAHSSSAGHDNTRELTALMGIFAFFAMDKIARYGTAVAALSAKKASKATPCGTPAHDKHPDPHHHHHANTDTEDSDYEEDGGSATGSDSEQSPKKRQSVRLRKQATRRSVSPQKRAASPAPLLPPGKLCSHASAAVSLHCTSSSGLLSLIADAVHNFTDGLAIAASFAVSMRAGITTTIAIFLHEIPHEIGDYAILIKAGFSHTAVLKSQFLTASAAFIGTLTGVLIESGMTAGFPLAVALSESGLVLPFAAGGFIYLALSTIIPEVLQNDAEHTGTKPHFWRTFCELLCFVLGLCFMAILD